MKKTVLKIAAITLALMLCWACVACIAEKDNSGVTSLSGTYSNVEKFTGLTLTFTEDGKVSVEHMSTARVDLVASGTYTIADGKITIAYTERTTGSVETAEKYSFTDAEFESGEGYIKIAGKEYKTVVSE